MLAITISSGLAQQAPNPAVQERVRKEVARLKSVADLRAKAIGKLVQENGVTSDDKSMQLLQQMVDELKAIREKLKDLEAELSPSGKKEQPKGDKPGTFQITGYGHFQYQDSDKRNNSSFNSFRFRRLEFGFIDTISPRVQARALLDISQGPDHNAAQMRDVYFTFDTSPAEKLGRDKLIVGQMKTPLGYELERSSSEREFPELAQYNQIFFPTERLRGVQFNRQEGKWLFKTGLFDSLAMNDPEQASLASGTGSRLAGTAAAKYSSGPVELGASGLVGERSAYASNSVISPRITDRHFYYVDALVKHLLRDRATLRAEYMEGKDRIPNATASATALAHGVKGFHVIGLYDLSGIDQFGLRMEQFDPNTSHSGDYLKGYGMAYLRNVAPNTKLTVGYEVFVDDSRRTLHQTRYGLTTVRLQIKF